MGLFYNCFNNKFYSFGVFNGFKCKFKCNSLYLDNAESSKKSRYFIKKKEEQVPWVLYRI